MATKHVPRPDYAYVGNHAFNIEWLTEDEWTKQNLPTDSDAATFSGKQYIAVRLNGAAQESHYQELLLHELTHAVWDQTSLTHVKMTEPEDPEEFIIAIQSPALLFVLKMNPHVSQWLLSDGTDKR